MCCALICFFWFDCRFVVDSVAFGLLFGFDLLDFVCFIVFVGGCLLGVLLLLVCLSWCFGYELLVLLLLGKDLLVKGLVFGVITCLFAGFVI